MIWTIVIWMAMQQQRHIPLSQCGIQANSDTIIDCSRPLDDPGIVAPLKFVTPSYKTMHSLIMPPDEPKEGQILGISDEIDAMGKQQLYWKYPDAEHVFEIRTKREEREIRWHDCKPVGNGHFCMNITKDQRCSADEINMGVSSAFVGGYVEKCVRITRELYMDGKRLGIIKGLD